jgi:hypothetical protein
LLDSVLYLFYTISTSPTAHSLMLDNMRRLHPRGPTNRGICVDADGAMLGPDCVLVEHDLGLHRPIDRRAAGVIQGFLLPDHGDPDWLFGGSGANEGDPGPSPETSDATAAELGTPPLIPNDKLPTTKQANAVIRSTAVWLGRAMMVLGPLFSSDPRVRAVWAAVNAVRWLAEYGPKIVSYLDKPKSLRALQDAVDHSTLGYESHHIVEAQRWSEHPERNSDRFRDRINSRENLVRIPYWKHVEISSWYFHEKERIREYLSSRFLRGKSWDEQYRIGLEVLRKFGVLE